MNIFSKSTKVAIVSICSLFLVGLSAAEIIYDPSTNTYINTSGEEESNTWLDDNIWIPVDDAGNVVLQQEAPTQVEEIEEIELVEEVDPATQPLPEPAEPVEPAEPQTEEEALVEVIVELSQEESVATTPTQEIVIQESDPILMIDEAWLDQNIGTFVQTANIKDLNTMKNESRETLLWYLDTKIGDLWDLYYDSVTARYGSKISELVQCVWADNEISQLQSEIDAISADLSNRIKLASADIHGEIASLKNSFDLWLMSKVDSEAEWWALATSIDASTQNFISLVDHYHIQAQQSISSFVDSQQASELDALVKTYNDRTQKLNQIKQSFGHFEDSSFFNQTVIGPRAGELKDAADEIFAVFEEDMLTRRGNRSPSEFETMIGDMKEKFDMQVASEVDMLFPYTEITDLYKSFRLVSDVYDITAESYNCSEIANNSSIDEVAPQLLKKIETVQQEIAVANSSVWWATDRTSLQQWLSTNLLEYYNTELNQMFKSAFGAATILTVETAVSAPGVPKAAGSVQEIFSTRLHSDRDAQMYTQYVTMVTDFLTKMKKKYVDVDNLRWFETKVEWAYTKLETMLTVSWLSDGNKLILEAIKEAIVNVLQGQ